MKFNCISWAAFILLCLHGSGSFAGHDNSHPSRARQGTLYVVLGVDTEPRPASSDSEYAKQDVHYLSDQSDTGVVWKVLQRSWRRKFKDSTSQPPKITWFVMTSEQICQSLGCSAVYDEMIKLKPAYEKWGDELGWHYHHTDWVTVDTGRVFDWNQIITLNGTQYTHGTDRQLVENSLNHLLVDRNFFPSVYRAGWCWENSDFSNWLEGVIPYDLSRYSPKSFDWPEYLGSRAKEFDWSRSSLEWTPSHPDSSDYQASGNMKRYLARCVVGYSKEDLQLIERNTREGHDQLFAWATHSYGMPAEEFAMVIDQISRFCDSFDITYKFVTATEGFRKVLNIKDSPIPQLAMTQSGDSILITAKGKIFQECPYVVEVTDDTTYARISPEKLGNNRWMVRAEKENYQKIYAAVSDLRGRSAIKSIDGKLNPDGEQFVNKRYKRNK